MNQIVYIFLGYNYFFDNPDLWIINSYSYFNRNNLSCLHRSGEKNYISVF